MGSSSFRLASWDPILNVAQIASLQSIYYLVLSGFLLVALALSGGELSLDSILDDDEIRTDTVLGWTLGLVCLVSATATIPLLVFIVQRAKLILDFVVTLHIFHIVLVWIHKQRFPTTGAWWLLQILSAVIMTLGGEWACMRREMKPIMMKQKQKATNIDADMEEGRIDGSAGEESSDRSRSQPPQGKFKRKHSGADPLDDEQADDHGPLISAVGKAKKVLMESAQRATQKKTNNRGRRYEEIPLKDVDEGPSH
ncbi:integral membrane protein S linking to the trans Golgi network-domain-containing protein [Radiomyces spectabilis]|uniref:integral membrane protein S linking to the trans Golgi network-domain-containing protein n=1 Tax=Radiomyces spectabilis TaxID=64574 RepID=UPI00221FB846|nr:integral membrane protein S linking to the trans Golgi network-domain-containing protein [Radiomyces spectabilis]KAI8374506.1 integral membrane protein S linking to the trans Golgi network-domain-containing protein [Radiomyces spectabilis]